MSRFKRYNLVTEEKLPDKMARAGAANARQMDSNEKGATGTAP